jgi:plastocyanin
MKVIISRLIIMTSIIMLAMGLLSNPIKTTTITPVFPQEEGSSVSIAPGAADPNNDLSFDPPQINVPTGTIVSWTNADSTTYCNF